MVVTNMLKTKKYWILSINLLYCFSNCLLCCPNMLWWFFHNQALFMGNKKFYHLYCFIDFLWLDNFKFNILFYNWKRIFKILYKTKEKRYLLRNLYLCLWNYFIFIGHVLPSVILICRVSTQISLIHIYLYNTYG